MGKARGGVEQRTLLGCSVNPREARREAARLRQQAEAAERQLAEAKAELAAARSAAIQQQQASLGHTTDQEARLARLQSEVDELQRRLAEAQACAAAAERRVEQLQAELRRAEQEAAAGMQREREAGRLRASSDAAHSAELAAQLAAMRDALAAAQEAASVEAGRARRCEAEAQRFLAALDELRSQQALQQGSSRCGVLSCCRYHVMRRHREALTWPCKPLAGRAPPMRRSCSACGRRWPPSLSRCRRRGPLRASTRQSASAWAGTWLQSA